MAGRRAGGGPHAGPPGSGRPGQSAGPLVLSPWAGERGLRVGFSGIRKGESQFPALWLPSGQD